MRLESEIVQRHKNAHVGIEAPFYIRQQYIMILAMLSCISHSLPAG